jgi:hypothetical protein
MLCEFGTGRSEDFFGRSEDLLWSELSLAYRLFLLLSFFFSFSSSTPHRVHAPGQVGKIISLRSSELYPLSDLRSHALQASIGLAAQI